MLFTRCLLISCAYLLLVRANVGLLASRSSYCCSLRAIHPHSCELLSLKIFIARCSLNDVFSALPHFFQLTSCTRSYLVAVRCSITFQFFLPVGWSFFFCCLPLAANCSRTRCLLHAIGYHLHAAQRSPLTVFGFRFFSGKSTVRSS